MVTLGFSLVFVWSLRGIWLGSESFLINNGPIQYH